MKPPLPKQTKLLPLPASRPVSSATSPPLLGAGMGRAQSWDKSLSSPHRSYRTPREKGGVHP